MDLIRNLLTPQTIDMIFSDPLLSIGAILIVVGIFLFLFSAFKYLRYNKTHQEFAVPPYSIDEGAQPIESLSSRGKSDQEPSAEERPPVEPLPEEPQNEPVKKTPEPAPNRSPRYPPSSDQTIVMPPGVADLQAQFEIAITQIKQLNRKIFEMESVIENLLSRSETKLEPNELKEPISNPEDFSKKFIKVVEHVIALEKEVAKIKSESLPHKSQIMPL